MSNAIFSNTGQVCLAPERVYVERPIFDKFVAALKARAEALVLGFPQDKATNMGPLISRQHREKVLSYYELARKEGAKVVTGGACRSSAMRATRARGSSRRCGPGCPRPRAR